MELHRAVLFAFLLIISCSLQVAVTGNTPQVAGVRQGRLLGLDSGIKKFRKLGLLQLWTGLFSSSGGKGSFASSNSYNLFGKTINSALSISYGDRGQVPVLPTLPVGNVPVGNVPVVAGAATPALAVRGPQSDTVVVNAAPQTTSDLTKQTCTAASCVLTRPSQQAQPQVLENENDLRRPMAKEDDFIRDQKFTGGALPEADNQISQPSFRQNIVVDLDNALHLLESEQFRRFINQHNAHLEVFANNRKVGS